MEQDVDNGFRAACCTCLCSDRDLYSINNYDHVYQIFRLMMYDFAGDRLAENEVEIEQLVCWECLALLKRFVKFKWQVHSAQEHLRVLALSQTQESMDHTYISQSLSSLEIHTKTDYDKIYFEFSTSLEDDQQYIAINSVGNIKDEQYDVIQTVKSNMTLDMDENILNMSGIVLDNSIACDMSQIVVGADTLVSTDSFTPVRSDMPELTVEPMTGGSVETVIICKKSQPKEFDLKAGYITEVMTEAEMMAMREEAKKQVQYASSVYKCELCIIGFYTQHEVENHFVTCHRKKPNTTMCKVCYAYVETTRLVSHVNAHSVRYACSMCARRESSARAMRDHVRAHLSRAPPASLVPIGDSTGATKSKTKKKQKDGPSTPPKPGDLRKLLSKTTIEGYQCLECDMFFKNSRARKNHVARCHREGLQCDHCKKRFVNRTTLATHLRLHEGPLPRTECHICHKMVRTIQIKYHIRRHENKSRYSCAECNKVFSHLATYQAHLKYSRAHATEYVFKFPCPMCNKGYPTKNAMQDHFNYQHLGKTSHKCPVCDKPIASRANVEKHMMRVHGEKKEKPRNHVCQMCGKAFTDKKSLTQHEVIHSGERPLSCDICHQTFKQKASLYTHRKRVHKVFPPKRLVQYMDAGPAAS